MSWSDQHCIVLRRSPSSDPEDAASVDVMFAVKNAPGTPIVLGSNSMAASGRLGGRSRCRWRFDISCLGYTREADDGEFQSYGAMLRLIEQVLVGPEGSTLWIWRAYEHGSATDTPLERTDYDRSNPTSSTTTTSFWNLSDVAYQQGGETYPYTPAGRLPMEVVLDGEAQPNDEGGGIYSFDFTLFAVEPHTP